MLNIKSIIEQKSKCEPEYFKPIQAAKKINVSLQTIFRMIKAGEIKAKRFGGSVRIESTEFIKNIKDY